jgi:hypothetical protein
MCVIDVMNANTRQEMIYIYDLGRVEWHEKVYLIVHLPFICCGSKQTFE